MAEAADAEKAAMQGKMQQSESPLSFFLVRDPRRDSHADWRSDDHVQEAPGRRR